MRSGVYNGVEGDARVEGLYAGGGGARRAHGPSVGLTSLRSVKCTLPRASGLILHLLGQAQQLHHVRMASNVFSWQLPGDWPLNLRHIAGGYVTGTSAGQLAHYSLDKYSRMPTEANMRAHEGAVNQVETVDEHVMCSVSSDGLKVWDLRSGLAKSQLSLHNAKKSKFLSVACGAQASYVAAGTELVGVDAEVHLWDIRKAQSPVRSFVDSHHDDVTYLEFHDSRNYLMSGSTDGYVNVYNLSEADEDDALHQVVNFASVHQCTFLQPWRIGVLTHMETLGVFELNSTDYDNPDEPAPHVLGDVRGLWPNCEYVVHMSRNGYVAYGANLASSLTVVPFDVQKECVLLDQAVHFPGAHGDEVVRDFLVLPGGHSALSCGEDGLVKAWEAKLHFADERIAEGEPKALGVGAVSETNEKGKVRDKKAKDKSDREKHGKGKTERRRERKEKKEKNRFKPY